MGFKHGRQLGMPIFLMVVILALNFRLSAGKTDASRISIPYFLRRNLLDTNDAGQHMIQSDDTVRADPLNNLKKYRGGYDITSKHYWSSTIFTGIYGYAIGLWWLLVGIIYGGFLLAKVFCCKTRRKEKLQKRVPCHKHCYLWSILLAAFFTVLAITVSGLILAGNARFNTRARTVVNIIIDTANKASHTIHNTTGAMQEMAFKLEETNSTQAIDFLTSTSDKLNTEAGEIQRQARKNRRLIDKGLTLMYAITTVTVSLNLVAVIALLVSGALRFRRALYLIITLCWILTFLCWLLFGLYFFLEKFASDTCTALENFQQNPYNNSLSPILPCDELLSARPVLFDVSEGIYNIVNQVNENISLLHLTSYMNIPFVCNPFSGPPYYQYLSGYCPDNTIHIGDIPKVLKFLTCSNSGTGNCENGGLMSNDEYKTVEAYTSSIQNLLMAYPGIENLVECQSVKDAFSEILINHCKPLKKYVHTVYAGLLSLSMVMVALILTWTTRASHEEEVQSSNNSVRPHLAMEHGLELGTSRVIKDHSKYPSLV